VQPIVATLVGEVFTGTRAPAVESSTHCP
jgi:hypothetical protein